MSEKRILRELRLRKVKTLFPPVRMTLRTTLGEFYFAGHCLLGVERLYEISC